MSTLQAVVLILFGALVAIVGGFAAIVVLCVATGIVRTVRAHLRKPPTLPGFEEGDLLVVVADGFFAARPITDDLSPPLIFNEPLPLATGGLIAADRCVGVVEDGPAPYLLPPLIFDELVNDSRYSTRLSDWDERAWASILNTPLGPVPHVPGNEEN